MKWHSGLYWHNIWWVQTNLQASKICQTQNYHRVGQRMNGCSNWDNPLHCNGSGKWCFNRFFGCSPTWTQPPPSQIVPGMRKNQNNCHQKIVLKIMREWCWQLDVPQCCPSGRSTQTVWQQSRQLWQRWSELGHQILMIIRGWWFDNKMIFKSWWQKPVDDQRLMRGQVR